MRGIESPGSPGRPGWLETMGVGRESFRPKRFVQEPSMINDSDWEKPGCAGGRSGLSITHPESKIEGGRRPSLVDVRASLTLPPRWTHATRPPCDGPEHNGPGRPAPRERRARGIG